MVYSKNISRKKDFETIIDILQNNEFYLKEIKVTYDKNFFFYTVKSKMKDEKENPRELRNIGVNAAKKLYQAGFVIQEYYHEVLDTSGIVTGFSLSDSVKVKDLVYRYEMILVRETELQRYFMRGSFF